MEIRDLKLQESLEILKRARLGRLGCACNGQPYVTPVFLVFEDNALYGFSSVGRKINWMRANPLVCVQFDELVSPQNWASVIIEGKFQELPQTPEFEHNAEQAYELLRKQPIWWEPAYVKTILRGNARPLDPVYFRILVESISGHRGVPEASSESPVCWMRKLLGTSKRKIFARSA